MADKWMDELSKYQKQGDLSKKEKAKTWKVAIGLQEVDGLKPSNYLLDLAKENIEGNVDFKSVYKNINNYYKESNKRKDKELNDSKEADIVSVKIAEILSDNSFTFSPLELLNIHKKLFSDIYKHAGKVRDYNIVKEEWVLNKDTVIYSSYDMILDTLNYDFDIEKNFTYKDLSIDETIKHISRFTSNIWQIHPFFEGNTRTCAVFIIKYLRTFGFDINDEMFEKNSWYFRNALVRANYRNIKLNVYENYSYLEKFFYNLLTDSKYKLRNKYLHISYDEHLDTDIKERSILLEEQAIINLIKDNSKIKQEEIALLLNVSLRTVKSKMKVMQDKGMIKRINGKKKSEWIVL
ncbi:MAG: Fic family protein [Clostridia bacterium]|nr:Fic family protein [Clostridia bacterium]